MMEPHGMTRRELVWKGSAALAGMAGMALLARPFTALAYPSRAGEEAVPFLDPPPAAAMPGMNLLDWEKMDSWITPNEKFFHVAHYSVPEINAKNWRLEIAGLVDKPRAFTLDELKAMPKREYVYTLECSGNRGFPWFAGGIGTARFGGVPLRHVMEQVGMAEGASELVFFGADEGPEEVHGQKITGRFARALSAQEAQHPDNLLCYEMNGEPLPPANGFPLRVIAPQWYGIADVKWLSRIEVQDRRYVGRFMGRDYVTLRGEKQGDKTVWSETSVGRKRINSYTGRVTRVGTTYRIYGAAWGAPIAKVEVKIDDGRWQEARIDRSEHAEYAWSIWSLDWDGPAAGEHAITSRAIDSRGQVQPAMDDSLIVTKRTYWESNGQSTRHIRVA